MRNGVVMICDPICCCCVCVFRSVLRERGKFGQPFCVYDGAMFVRSSRRVKGRRRVMVDQEG